MADLPDIRPLNIEPVGDDQAWKRDVIRLTNEVIRRLLSAEAELARLRGRIN